MANIAVIGTGISGLGASFLLHPHHAVTVYEKAGYVGGHTRTRAIQYGDKTIPVDTGFIVFNYRNYPNLAGLFKLLNVPVQKSNMSFGVTAHNGALEWSAESLNAVFGQRSNLINPTFYRFLFDVLHFNRQAIPMAKKYRDMTLGGMLKKLHLSDWFAEYYLLPMGGAIWSCPLETILDFPAETFVDFFESHGLLTVTDQPQWHTVTGGSKEYIDRLIPPFKDRIRTSCAAVRITRANGKVQVTDSRGETIEYDQLVLACHGNEALSLLGDASAEERQLLGAFRYQPNKAVLHRDAGLMPQRRRCWASWIYHAEKTIPRDIISVTYWMNQLQAIDNQYPVFLTLNPYRAIDESLVFDTHMFEHPIYSTEAVAAQARIQSIQGKQNTWFCGAHLKNGFHEDGLSSAVGVAKALGARIPWQ